MKTWIFRCAMVLLLTSCEAYQWSGPKPDTDMEKYAFDGCNCLKKTVKKTGVNPQYLVETGLKLLKYSEEGLPAGITRESAMQQWEEFKTQRDLAREEFGTVRSLPCLQKTMEKVRRLGHRFFDLGAIMQEHCLLAQVFTASPGTPGFGP